MPWDDKSIASAHAIAEHLEAADFPAGKQGLIEFCRQNEVPGYVILAIYRLPNRPYSSIEDVANALDALDSEEKSQEHKKEPRPQSE